VVQQVVACLHQQPLSELSLLFCYMQPYGLLSSVLHFIERAMLKVLSWASHDWKKNQNKKTGASMKIKRVRFCSFSEWKMKAAEEIGST
jgi:hypothetical protein